MLNRLDAEHDNFRAALEWSMETTVDKGLQLAAGLFRFWELRGYWFERLNWLKNYWLIQMRRPQHQPGHLHCSFADICRVNMAKWKKVFRRACRYTGSSAIKAGSLKRLVDWRAYPSDKRISHEPLN